MDQNALPKPISGFEHINRYWDRQMEIPAAKIMPGECYVSLSGELISTVLGSCISACARDRVLGIGGMNHFMLPMQHRDQGSLRSGMINPELCYGNWAMEYLINAILRQGGKRERLEIKLFGGGRVLSGMTNIDVGKRNIEFARQYLKQEGFSVVAEDVGGEWPRKVLYFPDTGNVKLRRLRSVINETINVREKAYFDSLNKQIPKSDIELF
jgi:chemotaxis protein CheD